MVLLASVADLAECEGVTELFDGVFRTTRLAPNCERNPKSVEILKKLLNDHDDPDRRLTELMMGMCPASAKEQLPICYFTPITKL